MNNSQLECMGLIIADFVRCFGMMSENIQRQALGQSMAYSDDSFEVIASNIEENTRRMTKED